MKPAPSAENPRSCVRYRTRNVRTIEPARLTSCEAETIHTGRGRCRRSFQYFNMGSEVCTGSAGPEFSETPQQRRGEEGEESEYSQESEDVKKDRKESGRIGILTGIIHGFPGRRASVRRRSPLYSLRRPPTPPGGTSDPPRLPRRTLPRSTCRSTDASL